MNYALIILLIIEYLFSYLLFFTVKQQTSVIIERFGRFHSVRQSGLQLKIPLIDRVAGRVNLKISN
jgi:regulator of protease activity HflC (stomatin/prohibitin superfamily)